MLNLMKHMILMMLVLGLAIPVLAGMEIQRSVVNSAGGQSSNNTTLCVGNACEFINGCSQNAAHSVQSGYMIFMPAVTPTLIATCTPVPTIISAHRIDSNAVRSVINLANPCKGQKIRLELRIKENNTYVYVRIYNLNGEYIKLLSRAPYEMGVHELEWSGLNNLGKTVGAGIYIIHVQIGRQTFVLKAAILK